MASCSSPNKEYIEKIKQQVKEDALGVEMNYKNISFEWTDTLTPGFFNGMRPCRQQFQQV